MIELSFLHVKIFVIGDISGGGMPLEKCDLAFKSKYILYDFLNINYMIIIIIQLYTK